MASDVKVRTTDAGDVFFFSRRYNRNCP